jgi:hypothetical protein
MLDDSIKYHHVAGEVSMNGYKTGTDGYSSALRYTKATFTAADETKLKAILPAMSGVPVASTTLTVADGATGGVVVSYVMVGLCELNPVQPIHSLIARLFFNP